MRLAISTAHDACSVALMKGEALLASMDEPLSRGHDARLAPMIAELLAASGVARPDDIVVDVGPGSFTGIRVGVAMARGLGLSWGVPVHGCASDRIVAVQVFRDDPLLERLLVLLDGRRGELFAREHSASGPIGVPAAISFNAARERSSAAPPVAGPIDLGPSPRILPYRPVASACRWLGPVDMLPPSPIYVRAPDAKFAA